MEIVDDGWGETRLSREKARRAESWQMLEDSFEKGEVVSGIINGKVKGGFTVDVSDIRAFLPGSLVDIRPLRETAHLEGKPIPLSAPRESLPGARASVPRTGLPKRPERPRDGRSQPGRFADQREIGGIRQFLHHLKLPGETARECHFELVPVQPICPILLRR